MIETRADNDSEKTARNEMIAAIQQHGAAILPDRMLPRLLQPNAAPRLLERRALLVYTGQSRISGDTISAVIDAYRRRSPRVVAALSRMKDLAEQMIDALQDGDIDDLAGLVAEHWTHQRSLHPRITTERIETIMERAHAAGALGGKALGASGGGCVLLIAADTTVAAVRDAVAPLGELVRFAIDLTGLTTESVSDRVRTGGGQWA